MKGSFFIDRPIFATVISIVIVLAGLVTMFNLAVEQYPDVLPPEVVVEATYPGASAEVLAETVAAPLEEQINGVENMIYMSSNSSDAGTVSITVVFATGTDPDQATIDVNNRVQVALPRMPQQVRDMGVRVEARSTSILQLVAVTSPDGTHDQLFMGNYALLNVVDELRRVPGVGGASLFAPMNYSMRVWLHPDRLAEYGLMASDVAAAIRAQNVQLAAGQFGAEPAPAGQAFTYTVTTRGRLADEEEFGNIVLRANDDGSALRLRDVARVELGGQSYAIDGTLNGAPVVPIGVYLQPGANALDTARAVADTVADMSARAPPGLEFRVPFDTSVFVQASVREVAITFLLAIALVVFVVFMFLQHLRATLIPVVAVPVSLIGTFAGMYALGFSINLLTLFGMILAIGIVVDNAIIVIENCERVMREQGLSARDAAVRTMQEVRGPVIASTLVLVAVFVPVGFMAGLTGELYRQFAITIAISVVISGVVALTLTPAMCAALLERQPTRVARPLQWFNAGFERVTAAFLWCVGQLLRRPLVGVLAFLGVIALALALMTRLPGGLVPQEDQGILISSGSLPVASSLGRTGAARDEVVAWLMQQPEVENVVGMAGFDVVAGGQKSNGFVAFMQLTDWSERRGPGQDVMSVAGRLMGHAHANVPSANVVAFGMPPIQGLSLTGGFEAYLQNRDGASIEQINATALRLVQAAAQRPELANVRTTLDTRVPRYNVDVDRERANAIGVPVDAVYAAMQSTLGSLYVNDFTLFGRSFQVNLQSDAMYRDSPESLRHVYVRSAIGEMVPLDSLVRVDRTFGPDMVERFNVFPAARVLGDPAPGYSSGQAIAAMLEVEAEVLDAANTLGWIGTAYQELETADAALFAFGLGLLMVFLILAAQYERWSLPLVVVTAVPFAVLGAVIAVMLRGLENDIYFQIGLLVLIGLSAKNAILIVEFAVLRRAEGMSIVEAATEAARQRFRAIVMTAMTFILGVIPLAASTGAGAAARHSVGTGVIGGMLLATVLATLFVPLFFRLVESAAERARERRQARLAARDASGSH